jgi:hypothetical protein
LKLLERTLASPSGMPAFGGSQKVNALMVRLLAALSFVGRLVDPGRPERERLLAEQEEQAAIARLVAMFETPAAVATAELIVVSPRRELVPFRNATVTPSLGV